MVSEDDRTDDGASGESKKTNFLKKLLHLGRKSSEKALAEKRDAAEKALFDDTSELDASTRAWARAYKGLRTSKKDLMEAYDEVLREQLAETMAESSLAKFSLGLTPDAFARANAHTATRISSLKAVTSSAQDKANKHAKLEGHIMAVGEFGKKMQDTISAALTAYPLAGMAWSGLCAVAPYIAQPLSSRKDMRDGLEHVIDQLGWYMDLVRVLLRSSWEKGEEFAQLQKTLEACVVQLYEKLVLYQVHVVVEVFHTNKLVKLIKVYLGQTNWAQEIEDIKNLEQSVVKRISQGLKVEVAEHLRGLSSHVVSIDETLLRIEKGAEEDRIREAVERHGDLIGKFKAIDYEYVMKMNPLRVEGTCEWICQHPGFRSWLDGPDKMLLVSADPGCGKSVLARYLVEDFLPRQKPESAVCYFFFKEQLKPENREPTVALCAILHSLFTQRPLLVDACNKAVREAGNRLQSDFTALWDIFEKVVTDKTAGPVLVVLDALDECNPKERERLLGRINILLSRPEKASGVKFLCTTRGYPRIADLFDALGTSKVRLSGEDKINAGKIQKEIGLVVEHRLKELAKPPKSLVESQIRSIRDALGSNGQTQRTYLWVKLMFDALEEELDNAADDIATLVAKLPQTLSGVYETLLRRVKSDDFDAVQIVLRLVIAANRPLTLRELNTALKVRGKIGVKNEAALHLVPDDNFRRWVSSACGFFLSVHDEFVYFIHLTAKEFLMNRAEGQVNSTRQNAGWAHSITERDAQATMSESCIAYLSIRHFHGTFFTKIVAKAFDQWAFYGASWARYKTGEDIAVEIMAGEGYYEDVHEVRERRSKVLEKYGFLEYVCGNWLDHFHASQYIEGTNMIRDVEPSYIEHYTALLNGQNLSSHPWFRITLHLLLEADRFKLVKNEAISFETARQLAAYFGHLRFLKMQIATEYLTWPENRLNIIEDESLAHWASLGGSAECVRYLNELVRDSAHATLPLSNKAPLVWAAAGGHIDAMKALADHGTNELAGYGTVNNQDSSEQNALLTILNLFSSGDIHLTDQEAAARFRTVIKVLVSLGSDLRLADKDGSTALHHSRAGIDEVDPDVDAAVLEASCVSMYPPKKNYHPKQKSKLPEIPLLAEFEGRQVAYHSPSFFDSELFLDLYDASILKHLISNGASVSAQNKAGETALHIAAQRNVREESLAHPWNVLFLLHAGADIEAKDNDGRTPLFSAIRTYDIALLRVLLAHGAKPNTQEKTEGKTPIHLAAIASQHARALTYHLLRGGADCNLATKDGSTVLHIMAKSFGLQDGVLPLLLDTGRVKIDTKNKAGWTALHYAAERGNLPMLKALLEKGANANVQTKLEKKTPLHLAIFERHPVKVIEQLLNSGASASIPDRDGQTPLHVLCSLRPSEHSSLPKEAQMTMARLLLEHSGIRETVDKEGRTASNLAKEKGLEELVEFLDRWDSSQKDPANASDAQRVSGEQAHSVPETNGIVPGK